jgi:hypothetical protein
VKFEKRDAGSPSTIGIVRAATRRAFIRHG